MERLVFSSPSIVDSTALGTKKPPLSSDYLRSHPYCSTVDACKLRFALGATAAVDGELLFAPVPLCCSLRSCIPVVAAARAVVRPSEVRIFRASIIFAGLLSLVTLLLLL